MYLQVLCTMQRLGFHRHHYMTLLRQQVQVPVHQSMHPSSTSILNTWNTQVV
jgi:hypothetical protein